MPTWRSSPRYQTGIWWPHQSWREMHHGRILPIHSKYRRSWPSGWIVIRPLRTTSIAGVASSSIRMNHCSEISGSIRSPERCEYGTLWTSCSVRAIRPSARSASTTASRASSTGIPANRSPAASVMRPSSPITVISSSPWARPISKSFGSCPGVIFSAPVPNSGLTYSSAMIFSRRPTSGRIAVSPIRRV